MKIFGKAMEFYRIRLQRMSEELGLEMEWDDSILYRRPLPVESKITTYYLVQAVDIDNNQAVILKRFLNKKEAVIFKNRAVQELAALTKAQFEEKFIK